MGSEELSNQRLGADRGQWSESSKEQPLPWQVRFERFVEDSWRFDSPQRVAQAVLLVAAVGAVVTAAAVAPGITALLRPFVPGGSLNPRSVNRAVHRLERRGDIRRKTVENSVFWELTPAGRSRLDRSSIDDLKLPSKPPTWDGEWRIVFFDVPEERKALRAIFRRKLQSLGFKYLQRSVWIYPHPCEAVLTALAERLQLSDHIHIAGVHSLSSDALVRQSFRLDVGITLAVSTASRQSAVESNRITDARRSPVSKTPPTVADITLELLPIDEL